MCLRPCPPLQLHLSLPPNTSYARTHQQLVVCRRPCPPRPAACLLLPHQHHVSADVLHTRAQQSTPSLSLTDTHTHNTRHVCVRVYTDVPSPPPHTHTRNTRHVCVRVCVRARIECVCVCVCRVSVRACVRACIVCVCACARALSRVRACVRVSRVCVCVRARPLTRACVCACIECVRVRARRWLCSPGV